jgi:hypothetical protein
MIQLVSALDLVDLWFQSILALAATAYALLRGGPKVRGAAIVNAIGWIVGGFAAYQIKPMGLHLVVTCASDAVVAVGLLYFTLKYDSPWLSLGVVAQGLQLALDSFVTTHWREFALVQRVMLGALLNGLTAMIQISILGAAIAERRRLALAGPVRVYAPTSARRPGPAAGGAS